MRILTSDESPTRGPVVLLVIPAGGKASEITLSEFTAEAVLAVQVKYPTAKVRVLRSARSSRSKMAHVWKVG